jgi:hypothetical protein
LTSARLQIRPAESEIRPALFTQRHIWGFAFVAQRMGMDHVGPFTFNGIRFFLGRHGAASLYLPQSKQPASRKRIRQLARMPNV